MWKKRGNRGSTSITAKANGKAFQIAPRMGLVGIPKSNVASNAEAYAD